MLNAPVESFGVPVFRAGVTSGTEDECLTFHDEEKIRQYGHVLDEVTRNGVDAGSRVLLR